MICNAIINAEKAYYPFGNTPAVSLTQDLPPEQDADILLLGCGDARNVLFTCFADVTRKIDVTCCDWEPGVLARNVLLYTLLIEDEANQNVERIWNIYYHWKLDNESLNLLETQTRKLLRVSESMDQWHNSVYGSSIRFWDAKSLSLVRSYWLGFSLQGLSLSEKAQRLNQLQASIERPKAGRTKIMRNYTSGSCLRAAAPIGLEALEDLRGVANQWWDHGTMPSKRASTLKATNLNPALLYSPNRTLTLYCGLEPLLGFPLSKPFTTIAKGSALHLARKSTSREEHLVDCTKSLFAQWASAFRKAKGNKSVIRIFCGDALAFCITLRNFQPKSTNLVSNGHLEPHNGDCCINAGPFSFDIIDTSNIADHVGPLNVISVASSLLKYNASSTLYTETLVLRDSSLVRRLSGFFGVEVRSLSLLLGLVSPELFTNATDSFEEDPVITGLQKLMSRGQLPPETQARSRLRWKRLQESSIQVEAKSLAGFLFLLHNAMFKHEDLDSMFNLLKMPSMPHSELLKIGNPHYNRASFALLLSRLRATIVTDWDHCVKYLYDAIFSSGPITLSYSEDLLLNMHLYGVDNGSFIKPTPVDMTDAILAPIILPFSKEDIPELVCVTVRVSREQLKVFTSPDEIGTPAVYCSFEGGDPGKVAWSHAFSSVRCLFGTWHVSEGNNSHPYIEEDITCLSGTSDMFVSVMVPTKILLQSKQSVPKIKCMLILTPQTLQAFISSEVLNYDLCFARSNVTSENVFITRSMPGMSVPPATELASARKDKLTSATTTTVQLAQNGSQVNALIRRVTLESEAAKTELANQSSVVEIEFKTPLEAIVSIAQSYTFEIKFPVPVSPSKYKLRIARKSGYIEVEAPLFDPVREESASFLFPAFISEVPCDIVLWTSTRIDLDAMPLLDLKDASAISWLIAHASLMFSERERQIRKHRMTNPSGSQGDIRTNLKDGLFSILMYYTGLQGQQAEIFGLRTEGGIQTLFFPSCLRLDLVNHTVVLDTAMIPVTKTMSSDPRAIQFLEELTSDGLCEVKVSQDENLAWKAMMPALVERCRTAAWKHTPDCEYVHVNEVPLPRGLSEDGESPICSCGIGKFPHEDYLKSLMNRIPNLRYMVDQYATRAALAPVFAVPYVEDCSLNDLPEKVGYITGPCLFEDLLAKLNVYFIDRGMLNKAKCVVKEKCVKCKRENGRANEQGLLRCSRCKMVRYCSKECQKGDWKKHKPFCSASLNE